MPQTILDSINSIEILEGVKALAPVFTLWVAYRALRNWQRQDKAKREAEFLDQLLDAVHRYLSEMKTPITVVEFTKIGIKGYVEAASWHSPLDADINGTIKWMQNYGAPESKRILDTLESAKEPLTKLMSLTVKGQMFGFAEYGKCKNAVLMLEWQYNRMQGFAAMLGTSPTVNFANPEVRTAILNSTALDGHDIRKHCDVHGKTIVGFARETYALLYDPPSRATRLLRLAGSKLRAWKSPTAPPQS